MKRGRVGPPAAQRGRSGVPPRSGGSSPVELEIDGRRVKVTHLEKVLYPEAGFTKADVIDYYIRISPVLMPHLRDRPLTLKRYPDGVEGGFFYEKRCPAHRPAWVKTTPIWSERYRADIHFCVASDVASLVWAANLADLELHTNLSRARNVESPTMVVFDLDPGPPADILQCAEVSFLLKGALDHLGLESFPKTSGSKGLQIYVPLNTRAAFPDTKAFARTLAEALAREHPDRIVSKMDKAIRRGKVLIDWSQNDRHKTTICVYSLRAKPQPTVSTPLTWDEVHKAHKRKDTARLSFLSHQVLRRVEKLGDLFEPVLALKQKLPRI